MSGAIHARRAAAGARLHLESRLGRRRHAGDARADRAHADVLGHARDGHAFRIHDRGPERDAHNQGWMRVLGWLQSYLQRTDAISRSPPSMKPSRICNTHGAFSWSELTTSDPKEARRFYGKLLGWQFQDMDMGTGMYTVINVGGAGHRRHHRHAAQRGRACRPRGAATSPSTTSMRSPTRGRTGRARAARTDGHPDRRPLRDDHGPARRDAVAHHLRQEELDAMRGRFSEARIRASCAKPQPDAGHGPLLEPLISRSTLRTWKAKYGAMPSTAEHGRITMHDMTAAAAAGGYPAQSRNQVVVRWPMSTRH